jgi:hypothetical protein
MSVLEALEKLKSAREDVQITALTLDPIASTDIQFARADYAPSALGVVYESYVPTIEDGPEWAVYVVTYKIQDSVFGRPRHIHMTSLPFMSRPKVRAYQWDLWLMHRWKSHAVICKTIEQLGGR